MVSSPPTPSHKRQARDFKIDKCVFAEKKGKCLVERHSQISREKQKRQNNSGHGVIAMKTCSVVSFILLHDTNGLEDLICL
jgi:hypothetical protein